MVVGGVGTLWDIGVYAGLRWFSMPHWPALALSFGSGVAIGFVLTRLWVFGVRGKEWKGQMFRFLVVIGVMYLVNGLCMEGLFVLLPAFSGRSAVARVLAAGGTFPLSYLLHRRISFA